MNYDQRILFLKNWLKTDILPRFNMPRDLDPKIVAMDVIEAVNSSIASGTTQERMGQLVAIIAKEVAQSARSRTLPPIKDFIDAAHTASKRYAEPSNVTTSEVGSSDKINATRIRKGEGVSEYYIQGRGRQRLIEEFGMADSDFIPYELAIAAHKQ